MDQVEKLGADMDLRLMWLWQIILSIEEDLDLVTLASWIRAAYGQGYVDGQSEPYGKLQQDNGFRVPEKID